MTLSPITVGRRPRNPVLLTRTTLGLGLVLSSAVLATPPTDQQRVDRLVERIEAARINDHVPGVALAVVRDDAIIFARGFGLASIEDQTPVTEETIFAIGSSTKAFTGVVLGMMVDEGRLDWDDPVSKWLPYFTPEIDGDDEDTLLVRDLLCHRSGFTRMSMAWVSGDVSREEILRTANGAEPWAEFRDEFLYNNVMFMAAGMIAGEAAGSNWEALITDRIFKPLGMTDSCLTIDAAQADSRLALGYSWVADREDFKRVPMRNITPIGPAGSINSNVIDMAQWLRFQLARGEYESQRLLAADTHETTWTKQMGIAPGIGYGFGWMLREWEGQRVVEHGGNIDGFAAQVAMLPDANLGYVLLTNTGYSPLQAGSIDIVFDALAGDWEINDADVAADASLAEFEGVYVANYAHWDNEEFTVSVQEDGRLGVDIPTQRLFSLNPPGEDGRRAFAGVTGLHATFVRDEEGKVYMMQLYQNNLMFDVPRRGWEYPIETPLDELDKYQGKYRFDALNADVEVLVKNNHLAVDVPKQMVFELHLPDEDDKWQFRNNDVMKIAVSFKEGEFGDIESLTMYQMGQEHVLPRLADENESELPSLFKVFELARLDERQAALASAGILRLSGQARFAQAGVIGTTTITIDEDDRHHSLIDLGKFGSILTSQDGARAWADVSFSEFEELTGHQLETARNGHPASFLGDWRRFYDDIRVAGRDELDGRDVLVIKLKSGDLPGVTMRLDASNGDILKIDSAMELPELNGVQIPITTELRDWREVNGIRVPHEMVVTTQQNGRFIVTVLEVETGVVTEAGFFTISR